MEEDFATGSLEETVEELTQLQQNMTTSSVYRELSHLNPTVGYTESRAISTTAVYNEPRGIASTVVYTGQREITTTAGYTETRGINSAIVYSEPREINTTAGYNDQREINSASVYASQQADSCNETRQINAVANYTDPRDINTVGYNEPREIINAPGYQEKAFNNFTENDFTAEHSRITSLSQNEEIKNSHSPESIVRLNVYDKQFANSSQNIENQSNQKYFKDENTTTKFVLLTDQMGQSNIPQPGIKVNDNKTHNEFLVPLKIPDPTDTVGNMEETHYEYVIDQSTLPDEDGLASCSEKTDESVVNRTQFKHEQESKEISKLIENGKKRDPVKELFDTSMESSSTLTDDGYTVIQSSDTVEKKFERTKLEKLTQEKTMFSENLGLIPADSHIKGINQENASSKRVRTRKSFAYHNTSEETDDSSPVSGHKHYPGCYKCGSCSKSFVSICKLHNHFQTHNSGGSYHYDHMLKIAFPKYDTTCVHTQTGDDMHVDKSKPFGKGIKLKKAKIDSIKLIKNPPVVATPSVNMKRKRGRPKKVDTNQSIQKENKEKNSKKNIKIKVKTEDGGNTWQEVKNEPCEAADTSFLEDVKSDYVPTDEEKEEMEETTEDTTELVDKYLKEIETDIAKIIENDGNIDASVKKSRKRKMSKPRKLPVTSDSEVDKIINSRSKPELKIKCDFCPSAFQYTRGLMRHEQEKHPEEMKLECDVCHQKFMREYNLERHKLCSHTVGRVRLLRRKRGLLKEKKKPGRKPRDKSPEGSRACEMCGKVLPNSKAEIHLRLHTGERPYICHVCGKGLISDKKLKRHLLIHSEVQRHTCEVCGEGFSMKYKLRTHMFIHTGHKPYLCSVCGAEFNNSTSLLHHHRTVHLGDKRFECNICGGRYGKKSQLEEHMFSHSNERTQTCRYCGKTFKHAKSLRRHEFTHVSDKKFPCDQCDSKFSRKDNLERHKMCHFEGTLQCSFCKKKFRDRQPLVEHEQFHINQKRFQCQLCKEKFQEDSYFYNHMEKVHNLTRDMVPLVNALTNSKEDKKVTSDFETQNIVMGALKFADQLNSSDSVAMTTAPDTLNLSMNVAGIIPVASSVQDLIPSTSHNAMHSNLVSQNNSMNHGFNTGQSSLSLSLNPPRSILNQPINPSFASPTHIIPGMHDAQRAALNVMNAADGTGMRLASDQQSAPLALTTSENMMIHEQQRLMQEVLGSNLNMQNPGYRLQNLY